MDEKHGGNRFTIKELVHQQDNNPTLKFLIVEGYDDRLIYKWYVEELGFEDVFVYEINKVEISDDLLKKYEFTPGARQRIITLAFELDQRSDQPHHRIRCIADSDFDFIMEPAHESYYLMYTDYTSLEMYSCNQAVWTKTLELGFGYSTVDIMNMMSSMFPVWEIAFYARAVYTQLGWDWEFAKLGEYCRIMKKSVSFDDGKFIERSLRDAGRIAEWELFCEVVQELRKRTVDDPRKCTHKDDYLELLGWYLDRQGKWSGYVEGNNAIWKNLKPVLEIDNLRNEPMFGKIEEFVSEGLD